MIPSLSPTAVDISSQYNISIHNVSPFIVYNNTSYNNGLQNTTLHGDKTEAISNITSVWVDAAYSDDNCTMVTTSYGNTTLYSYSAGKYHNIGSPYNTEKYKQDYGKYGPITGIAGTKSYDGEEYVKSSRMAKEDVSVITDAITAKAIFLFIIQTP